MKISLTGSGKIAEEFLKICDSANVYSFRKLDDDEILCILKNTDILIHNAANINFNSPLLFEDNFGLTKRIVDIIKNNKIDILFVNIGSMSYLKTENSFKTPEEMSLYAFSKFMSEIYVSHFLKKYKLMRFSNLFYKDPSKDGLSKMIFEAKTKKNIQLINGGMSKRDWIPISIAAKYLKESLNNKSQIINICSGVETSFFEISEIIKKYISFNIYYSYEETQPILSKFTLMMSEINFSLEEEIKKYICEL